jgi:hypothetical protein
MKTYGLIILLLLAACAPVSQTIANVSNFVAGSQSVSYQASTESIASAIQDFTPTLPLYNGYTPLLISNTSVNNQVTEKITVSAKALKGSASLNTNTEDFSVDIGLTAKDGYTELVIGPSSASNETARTVVKDYVAKLDELFERYTPSE